jgi:outer membrane protein, multidrug efflux system
MKISKSLHIIILFIVSIFLSACSTKDLTYQKTQDLIPQNWSKDNAYKDLTLSDKSESLLWEKMVLDEKLKKVIIIALNQNRSLKEAVANIESARATYKIKKASEFPSLEADVSGNKSRSLNTSSSNNSTNNSESYSAKVGISSYELDFFGKAQNLTIANFENFLSVEQAQKTVRISLIAEVSNAWLTMASDKSLLDFAVKTSLSSKKSLDIIEARLKAGIDSKVTLYNEQTTYYQALADIEKYTTSVAQDQNALDLLVGQKVPESLLPSQLNEKTEYLSAIPVGLSSDILLNRPDILEAEHNLKAANANIEVARAAYFPSITITSAAGIASTALSNLFTGGAASVWSFAPNISLPIFDWGSKDASLDYAKSQRDLYLAKYELAIQTAFSEVSDALARYGTIENQLKAQENLVNAHKNSLFLSERRYKLGVDTYLNTLISQRSLYSSEQNLISLRLAKISNRATLYKVLANDIK